MRRYRFLGFLVLLPTLALLLSGLGCGGGTPTTGGGPSADSGVKKDGGAKGKREPLASTGWGTLTGVVLLEGQPPPPGSLKDREDYKNSPDRKECDKGDTTDPNSWRISSNNGVEYVVVWLQPTSRNQYFKMPEKPTWKEEVVMDQPYCAFEPHVVTLFPGYYDFQNRKQVSAQKLRVLNSAPMKHNTKWLGSPAKNPEGSKTLDANDKKGFEIDLQADTEPISISCDIHKWMKAYVWAFDHPYAAVTDKEGKFTIETVPAGADVDIMYWHESFGKTPKKLKTVKLTAGENKEEIRISASAN
jgi:hypothetical protein